MNRLFGSLVFWTVLSIVVLLIFSFFAFFKNRGKRRNYKTMAVLFMLGLYFSNVIFMSSLIYFGNAIEYEKKELVVSEKLKLPDEKNTVFSKFNNEFKISEAEHLFRDSIFYGLIYSTKMSGLGVKYQALIPTSFYFSFFSGIYFIILTILTPIAFGGLVASFFEGMLAIVKYITTSRFHDIYYFSELNEKSILLAKDIHDNQKHSLIVFCNKNKKWDSSLLNEAKYNRFILFSTNETKFVKFSKRKRYFFEMGTDESKNISSLILLLDAYAKIVKEKNKDILFSNHAVYIFAEKETTFDILNSINEKAINVIVLNRFKAAFYDLLLKRPLYKCLKDGRKDFSITIIGSGRCGVEILKACTWCTQLGSAYSTKINVIDKNAKIVESQLKKNCPEFISNYYDIKFFDCDVTTDKFYDLLKSECSTSNFITVATGLDDNNLRIAKDVRKFYLSNSNAYDNEPIISVFIENDEYLNSIKNVLLELNIETFGADSEFYSYSLVVNSDVEKLAINSSCVYDSSRSRLKVLEEYYGCKEIERDSNRTNAIHLIYKLYWLGYGIIKKSEAANEQIQQSKVLLPQLEKIINEEIDKSEYNSSNHLKAQLARIEHDRWNAYYRSEGWCGIPENKWEAFREKYKKTKSGKIKYFQKNFNIKQHVCICPYEKLESAEKVFLKDVENQKPNDFREYDFNYIKYLLNTLGIKRDIPEINISGVEYILVKLKDE